MGNAVFPALPGLTWNVARKPAFQTLTKRAVSGRELRATLQQYPLYQFSLTYEVLRAGALAELQTLVGFFLARQGAFDSFLYADPADGIVTDMAFGAGNGATTQFQLARAYGGGGFTFAEPVQNVNALTAVKVAGVTKTVGTDYTVSSTGLITFAVAPANGAALTWTGSFFYRCRFLADEADFNNFMKDLWELKKLEFVGAPGNKL